MRFAAMGSPKALQRKQAFRKSTGWCVAAAVFVALWVVATSYHWQAITVTGPPSSSSYHDSTGATLGASPRRPLRRQNDVYELLEDNDPASLLQPQRPCLVAHCPRLGYTSFRHYQLCEAQQAALIALGQSNNTEIGVHRLRLREGRPTHPRTLSEMEKERSCDQPTQTASRRVKRADLERCIDPRWPLRLPLTLHRLGQCGSLACYARGDMVCDIVGRSGGWEAELVAVLSAELAAMRTSAVRRLAFWREARYQQLEAAFGVGAVQRAIDAAYSTHRLALVESKHAVELRHLMQYDELFSRRRPGLATRDNDVKSDPLEPVDPGEGRVIGASARGLHATDHLYSQGLSSMQLGLFDVASVTNGSFGVEYIDIGANVGAFLMSVWRSGFPVTAFEALPYNMQLLSTTLCVNGLRSPSATAAERPFEDSDTDAATSIMTLSDRSPGPDGGPSVRIVHTALGSRSNQRCAMMSEDLNFGDTWISCNASHVTSTDEFPFEKYRRRGIVRMTRLDDLVLGRSAVLQYDATHRRRLMRRAAIAILKARGTTPDGGGAGGVSSILFNLYSLLPATSRFWRRHHVMKLDVEGHEVSVMEGARRLLSDPSRRPVLVLSEVWLSLNATRFFEIMTEADYLGWSVGFRYQLRDMDVLHRYNAMRTGQDTILWFQRDVEGAMAHRVLDQFPPV